MTDCASGGIKKTCWICEDDGGCDYLVCYETEITERIRQETTETIKREEEEEGESIQTCR